jgi:hypothetical protein
MGTVREILTKYVKEKKLIFDQQKKLILTQRFHEKY